MAFRRQGAGGKSTSKSAWTALLMGLALGLNGLGAPVASATASLVCEGVDDPEVEILLTLGSVPVLAIVGAIVVTPTATYSLNPTGDDVPIIAGQAFGDADGIRADFTDPNVERIILSLRTLRAEGDKQLVEPGTLSVEGIEVYAINCSEG